MAKRITEDDVAAKLGELLLMDEQELVEFVARTDVPVLQKSVAATIINAIAKGEFQQIEKILDRVVGKPGQISKAAKEVKKGLKERLHGVSRERLLEIVRQDETGTDG